MKTQLIDLAGLILVLAFAIVLPVFVGAELERRGVDVDLSRPAIFA